MTRLLFTGFEGNSNTFEQYTVNATAPTIDSSVKRSGGYSLKYTISAGGGGWIHFTYTGATARTYFARVYFYLTTAPATNPVILMAIGGASEYLQLRLKSDSKIYLHDQTNNVDLGSTSALSDSQWYRLEMSLRINTSTSDDQAEFLLDGVSIYSSTTLDLGTGAPSYIDLEGSTSTGTDTFTFNLDDFAFNDSQGSSNNSWPGSGNIICLKPVSDNARGANWIGGAGGTANLWQAVDNTPPVGVANASATDTSQVKNSTSDTTGNYDANITDYTTGGVGASDIINAIQGVWDIGCSSATSTSGATRVVSNPAEGAETSINFSNGVGAVTTWGGNWQRQRNAIIEAPSVTLGTQPVLRIGKRQATTRIGHCDFMGLMVDYTPVAAAATKKLAALGVGG